MTAKHTIPAFFILTLLGLSACSSTSGGGSSKPTEVNVVVPPNPNIVVPPNSTVVVPPNSKIISP